MDNNKGLAKVEIVSAIPQQLDGAIAEALEHYGTLIDFVKRVLQRDVDFGVIPGTRKPTLLKPGAEKLCRLFNLQPRFTLIKAIEDWTGKEHGLDFPLFAYHYRCSLYRHGEAIAEGEGVCSSAERKYRQNKNGAQGIYDSQNTICKMAQKRALIAAVLVATGASEFFTQDIEDWQDRIDGDSDRTRQPAQPQQQQSRKEVLMAESDALLKRLEVSQGWTIEQVKAWGRRHLSQHYATDSRHKLSDAQLADFVNELRNLTGSR